jgi:HD-like signal output (HDOD) protein
MNSMLADAPPKGMIETPVAALPDAVAAEAEARPARLLHLFRHTVDRAAVNPLLYLVPRLEGLAGPPPLPPRPAGTAGAAPVPSTPPAPLADDAVLARVRDLPALPAVVLEVIASIGDEDAGTGTLAASIARDQALAARTLRLANSPFYGMSRKITSINDAVAVLGLRTLKSMALAAGLANAFPPPRCAGFDFAAFWRHSIGTALAAGQLARALRRDEGLAFTVGLLHEIGRLALASGFADRYAEVLRHRSRADVPVDAAERALLGTDHAAVGGLLAAHWRFAGPIVEAIAGHRAPPQPPTEAAGPSLADLVHVADNMAHALDLSRQPDDLVPPQAMPAWCRLALDDSRSNDVMRETRLQHDAVCAAILN